MKLSPYLFFKGQCEEAIKFYAQCLGGKPEIMKYSDIPGGNLPPGVESHHVMHARIATDQFTLMASDSPISSIGSAPCVEINIDCDTKAEVDEVFKNLAQGGETKTAPKDEFWGDRYASFIDKFGIHWMITGRD